MRRVESIKLDLQTLNESEREEILNYLQENIILGSLSTQITNEVKESRFSRGKVCPHCENHEISRNGKFNGKQRYICKTCNKTFTDFTYSPRYNSKKDNSKWILYAKCMINGYSLRKCAEIVGISLPTSFYWRHKILEAIRNFTGVGSVGGVVEADEAFFKESFKGNHSRSTTFTMPRRPHKRWVKGSRSSEDEPRRRRISRNQVCVLCAMDREGNIITELICKGRMTHEDLRRLFADRIEDQSILCTDSHKSYIRFAEGLDITLKQIKRGRHKEGVYHIQHINAFHSKLKKWMDMFNGVSTKYLSNYMYWLKWLQIFNQEKDTIRSKNLLVQAHTAHSNTKIRDFRYKEVIFIQ
ncbi:IS1595 family transposase [uncultured Clostridium sp.]|uniref:IS1595 family transposase n=1 Tax=uncultured Clostridium sp. TaxID=59620 RepID=UPI0028EA808E|nr:IS1595 family transposase [uncultured Clostridium sp.]